jgi:hypothetical protein
MDPFTYGTPDFQKLALPSWMRVHTTPPTPPSFVVLFDAVAQTGAVDADWPTTVAW